MFFKSHRNLLPRHITKKQHNLHPSYYLQVASPVESANHIGPSPLMLIRELIQNLLIGFAQAIKVTTLEKSSAPKTSALNFKKLYLIYIVIYIYTVCTIIILVITYHYQCVTVLMLFSKKCCGHVRFLLQYISANTFWVRLVHKQCNNTLSNL